MNVSSKFKSHIDSQEFLGQLIALIISTLFIGYAPSSIALGLFVLFAFRYLIISGNRQKIDFKLLLPIALYLLFVLTLFWTVDIDQTKKGLTRMISLLLVPIAFNLVPKFTLNLFVYILRFFTGANILFGLFFILSSFLRYLKSKSLSAFTYHELVSDLDLNAIYVSVIFAISLFYILSKKSKTYFDYLKIVFFVILLVLLSSKTIFFVLILGFIAYVFYNRLKQTKLIIVIIIGVIVIGLASKKSFERFLFEKETKVEEVWTGKEFGQVYLWTGSSIRLLQLRILKEQIKEENIFWKGFGLFASKGNLENRHLKFKTYHGFHRYNYHNQYAQIISESGIFGFIILLSMLMVLFSMAFASKNYFLIMFTFTIALVFFTESLLYRQSGIYLFVILYSLCNRTVLEIYNHKLQNK